MRGVQGGLEGIEEELQALKGSWGRGGKEELRGS